MSSCLQTRRRFLRSAVVSAPALAAVALGADAGAPESGMATDSEVDLCFIEDVLSLVRRGDWASDTPRPTRLKAAGEFDRITIHHEGGTADTTTDEDAVRVHLQGILTGHFDRQYGDLAYHFVIDYAGRAWEGRQLAYEGAHVSCANRGNIGVMLLGNFEEQAPSSEQIDALNDLLVCLRAHYAVDGERIYGHRDLGHSVCPGRRLYPIVAGLRGSAVLAAKRRTEVGNGERRPHSI